MTAYEQGAASLSILSNPYWLSYPKRSTPEDEIAAMRFVDGWCDAQRGKP